MKQNNENNQNEMSRRIDALTNITDMNNKMLSLEELDAFIHSLPDETQKIIRQELADNKK